MSRYFVRTAAVVFCAAWAAGCGSTTPDKPTAPATPQSQPAADLPTTLDGEIARAHTLRVRGDYDESAKSLAQLMLVAPDDVRVVGEYGKVLAQEGRPGDAVPFLTRAIQIQPNDWTLYSALGVAYDQADQHNRARTAYEHALGLKPGQPDVLNNYAVSRMLAGDLVGARRLLDQAKRPGVGDAKIGNNLALLETMKPASAPPHPLGNTAPHPATADPKPTTADAKPTTADAKPTTADAKPATATATEQKPADPNAATGAPHKLADTKPVLRKQDGPPSPQGAPVLRTAADGQ